MMESNIRIFANPSFGNVRVMTTETGEPMFCLRDVCKILELTTPSRVKERLNQKGVSSTHTLTSRGMQSMLFINESNLYRCIFQSRKQNAERFQMWVCEEVLPSIRKNGAYVVRKENDTDADLIARALLAAQAQLERKDREIELKESENAQLKREIESHSEKVAFAEAIESASGSCDIADYTRVLGRNGVRIGQKRLFEWMRNNGYLGTVGSHWNKPVQYYVNMGVLELEVYTMHINGRAEVRFKPKVTTKGMRYFFEKLIREKEFFPRLDL